MWKTWGGSSCRQPFSKTPNKCKLPCEMEYDNWDFSNCCFSWWLIYFNINTHTYTGRLDTALDLTSALVCSALVLLLELKSRQKLLQQKQQQQNLNDNLNCTPCAHTHINRLKLTLFTVLPAHMNSLVYLLDISDVQILYTINS